MKPEVLDFLKKNIESEIIHYVGITAAQYNISRDISYRYILNEYVDSYELLLEFVFLKILEEPNSGIIVTFEMQFADESSLLLAADIAYTNGSIRVDKETIKIPLGTDDGILGLYLYDLKNVVVLLVKEYILDYCV